MIHFNSKRKRIISILIGKSMISAISFFLFMGNSFAQDGLPPHHTSVGISLRTEVCADGYGGKYLPGLFVTKGRKYYGLSAVLQTRNSNLAGFQFNYNYALTGEVVSCDRSEPELYFSFAASYHHNGMLGKRAIKDEGMANPASCEFDVANACFKSVEAFVGFGLKLELFKNFKWSNAIGVGGYTSLFTPIRGLYYESSALGLRLSTGVTYSFK